MMNLSLKPGDTIGVMAPSSYVESADIEQSAKALEALGYKIRIHPQTFLRHHQSAGTHQEKAEALHNLFSDPSINAVWAAGGGNRALHLLEHLDYGLIRANPKLFIGFSDATALCNAIYARCQIPTCHGPVFKQLYKNRDLAALTKALIGEPVPMDLKGAEILREGSVSGPLIGGCLSIFQYLPASVYMPDPYGAILVLEDTGDHLSRYDRMFLHLRRNGVLNKISGLIIGEFLDTQESARPYGFTMKDVLLQHSEGLDIPMIIDAPFGHGEKNPPLFIGRKYKLSIENTAASLTLEK